MRTIAVKEPLICLMFFGITRNNGKIYQESAIQGGIDAMGYFGRRPGFKVEVAALLTLIAVMWAVFLLDRITPLESLGLVPRTLGGLAGIITMPLLHEDIGHILSNTVPLLILGVLLATSARRSAPVMATIWILTGVLLWVAGRQALHIGASGLVFGLVAYLIVAGLLARRLVPLLISLAVGFLYGGMLLSGVLPLQRGVSWDGHLAGAVAGVISAWTLVRPKSKQAGW